MPTMLEDVEPYEVSLVPKAANKRKFLLFKSDANHLQKGVIGFQDLPLASRDREWDGDQARQELQRWAGDETDTKDEWSEEDWAQYRRGFLWYNEEEPTNFTSYKFPIAEPIDGTLTAVPNGIYAAAAVLEGARVESARQIEVGTGDIPDMQNHLERYYQKMRQEFDDESIRAPWDTEKEGTEGSDVSKKDAVQKQPNDPNQAPNLSVGAQNAIIGALRILQEYDEEIPNSAYEGLAELIDMTRRLENVPNINASEMMERSAGEGKRGGTDMELNKADLEGLPDDVQEMVTALYKERQDFIKKAQQLEEELARQREKEELAKYTEIAKGFEQIPAEVDELAIALRKLAKTDEKAYDVLEKALSGANEAIAKGNLFEEVGSNSSDGGDDTWSKIQAMANSLIEKDGNLTQADAIAKVLNQNPDLYDEYLKEGR